MKKYDLIVVGGGFSGVAAATCAARLGISVLLIEQSGALGGAMTNCLVYPFMPNRTKDPDTGETKQLSEGIYRELLNRQKAYCGSDVGIRFSGPEYYKFILDDMLCEAGVDVLFHTKVFSISKDNNKITEITATTIGENLTLQADFFIDATGDGNLFSLAGCDYQLGRDSDGYCQPMTTCFRMSGVDVEQFKKELPDLQAKYKELQSKGEIKNPREDILLFYGVGEDVLHFNTTRIIKHNPTDAFEISRAEMLARRQVYEMEQFLKANSTAFKNSTIVTLSNEIGVRESRKLKGEYILTAEDLCSCCRFEDSIALGNYDLDIHSPTGTGTSHYYFPAGAYYNIPYRALLPKEYDNMLVAGRCISTTHEAQASIRIMPICACIGQAAGTAAAIAKQTNTDAKHVDIQKLRETLIANGAKL